MKKQRSLTIKSGTVEDYLGNVKQQMSAADRGESIKSSQTLTFAEPTEMLHFLSATKIKLIRVLQKHADSITNIAKVIKRNRAAVYRDISELEKFGLVTVHEEINPGHGRHKIVVLVASKFKLEAYI